MADIRCDSTPCFEPFYCSLSKSAHQARLMQALESVLEYGPLAILLPLSIRPALQDRLLSESICIVARPYPTTSNIASTVPASGRSIQAAHFWSNLSSKVNSASLVSLYSMMNVLFPRTNSLERFDDERPNDPDISSAPWTTPPRSQNLPPLSGSVDSYSDEYTTKSVSESAPLEIWPRIQRLDSTSRSRHDSSDAFGKTTAKETASISVPNATFPLAAFKEEMMPVASAGVGSKADSAHQSVARKKAPAKFALGGSCSSCEKGMTVEMSKSSLTPPLKKSMFQVGGFSEPASAERDIQPAHSSISESAIDSDTDDDYVDESAIDDDDSSDWEDTAEESGKSSFADKFFQRVKPNVKLATSPSLITLAMARNRRPQNPSNQASQSASATFRSRTEPSGLNLDVSPNDLDEDLRMIECMYASKSTSITEEPLSTAQPSVDASEPIDTQVAFSPRTTRRNMLATELTESLCRHLLWERQQKCSTANAVLSRHHAPHDVAELKQFPEKPYLKKSEDANASSWNQYFNTVAFDGYHSQGW